MRAFLRPLAFSMMVLAAGSTRGDGLLYQLPKDGTWASYEFDGTTGSRGGEKENSPRPPGEDPGGGQLACVADSLHEWGEEDPQKSGGADAAGRQGQDVRCAAVQESLIDRLRLSLAG